MATGETKVWVGVDVGKGFHWAVGIDEEGGILFSRRVENEKADLAALVEESFLLRMMRRFPSYHEIPEPGGRWVLCTPRAG